ncbi:MAG: cupin domain-containing protein [Candidatus Omnitrophica bacterium]|nr:cupin domain-containing protein [Candidatus Omnitrophota bacterium]
MNAAEFRISQLQLQPHPEGGYYREVYRAADRVSSAGLPERYKDERALGTSIYFLLKAGEVSKFHRLQSDEIWYFHAGSPVAIHLISPTGEYQKEIVGLEIAEGQSLQVIIPHGHWFAAEVGFNGSYGLVSCAVFPGFEFNDFELADRNALLKLFPHHQDLIIKFT